MVIVSEDLSKKAHHTEEKPVSVSVFFPCYNEQDNVSATVKTAVDLLQGINADYEVIVVDDGSRDDTKKIAEQLSQENNRIKVVSHPVNLGYGAALQSGFRAASKELVFYTDGDGQFDIKEMLPLLELIKECDIVSCYRLKRQDNFIRRLNAWCWTRLGCFLFHMKVRDVDCAFKLYKRQIFDNIKMSSTGALIDTEIIARAIRKGYKITQKGVHHYPRTAGQQTGANVKVILRAFKELFELHRQIKNDD
jgi:glycosyltransferase involved in cell wall biosynthesis